MEKLNELIKVLNPKRTAYVDIFSHSLPHHSKLIQLHEGIRLGKITDDASTIHLLYGNDPTGKSKFAKLKSYSKKRLLNTALLTDAKHGKRMKAFFKCVRTFRANASNSFLLFDLSNDSIFQRYEHGICLKPTGYSFWHCPKTNQKV
ncbi:MAG: hypothetical protein AAGI23_16010 [Bacteroidota bacterium]